MKIKAPKGQYFTLENVPKEGQALTIENVSKAMSFGKSKYQLSFEETEQMLSLSNRNQKTLMEKFGDDSDDWQGKIVRLTRGTTEYQGSEVPCIIVTVGPSRLPDGPAQDEPRTVRDASIDDGDLPF